MKSVPASPRSVGPLASNFSTKARRSAAETMPGEMFDGFLMRFRDYLGLSSNHVAKTMINHPFSWEW